MEKKQSRSRFIIILAIFITVVNLLIYNDIASFWELGEVNLLSVIQSESIEGGSIAPLPNKLLDLIYGQTPLSSIFLRMPATLAMILTLGGLYFLGRRIFGEPAARMATLVGACSFLLLFFGKVVGVDAWLIAAQTFQILGLIYYLKQPQIEWSFRSNLPFFLGCYFAPIPMFLWTGAILLFYGIFHKNGKNILKPIFFIPVVLTVIIVILSGGLNWETPGLLMAWPDGGVGHFLIHNVLAYLPWLAFLPAALWDVLKKLRKREELAIIYCGWLLGALVAGTGVLQIVLALMIGRHVLFYFQKNYPYRSMVRSLVVTHFIFSFFGLFAFIMLAGYNQFGGSGYRAAIAVAIAYWGGSLVSVTAIFSEKQGRLVGSLAVAAMVGFLMFWLNGMPLLESRRGWNKIMVEKAIKYRSPDTQELLFFMENPNDLPTGTNIYSQVTNIKTQGLSLEKISTRKRNTNDLVVLPKTSFLKINPTPIILRDSINRYDGVFAEPVKYYIGKWR